ncbi:hypothetical protein F4780DRAFT_763481 [Xylariomycetidae sp. FL0641]|nr:hypothetical protein F4780DRAFT_763481 [Xylariomycetidae sp. FL0641]
MGRRPNALIITYFDRGAKLNDNSNRYHHRCKQCGEDFPKGRTESLVKHLSKKCPALSEQERERIVCAHYLGNESSGNGRGSARALKHRYDGLLHSAPNTGPGGDGGGGGGGGGTTPGGFDSALNQPSPLGQNPMPSPMPNGMQNALQNPIQNPIQHPMQNNVQNQEIWTPLETLAEVSRQMEATEKHDTSVPISQDPSSEAVHTTLAAAVPDHVAVRNHSPFELHEQFTLDNPPAQYDDHRMQLDQSELERIGIDEGVLQRASNFHAAAMPLIDFLKLQQQVSEHPVASNTQAAISVAAAATARLDNPALLDPSIYTAAAIEGHVSQPGDQQDVLLHLPETQASDQPDKQQAASTTPPVDQLSPPWASMAYIPDDLHGPAAVNDNHGNQMVSLNRGGFRMDTTMGPDGPRHRHSRARFDTARREQVNRVRSIGACIRCRILRKTCSEGTPCDACKRVLSPRIWYETCVRVKLVTYIDLYSAGVQVVMAQKRINNYKKTHCLTNAGMVVEASHFPETGHKAVFEVLHGFYPIDAAPTGIETARSWPVILLDNDKEDVPGKVQAYMREILPEFIRREPSPHVRVILEAAERIARETGDNLMTRALELWGTVEMMDRERQWTMLAKPSSDALEGQWIKDESESEAYTNICMQLTAAAERKASAASQELVSNIQRSLENAKIKLGFPMLLTIMLFLNCVEKTTWAFKAWDEENLRPKWPLEKPPGDYTHKCLKLALLLRMLLHCRHIMPKMTISDEDLPITVEDDDPACEQFFRDLNVTPAYLRSRYEQNNFQPTDSRSLEFSLCAPLLMNFPGPPMSQDHQDLQEAETQDA